MKKLIIVLVIIVNYQILSSQSNVNYKVNTININDLNPNSSASFYGDDFVIYSSPKTIKNLDKKHSRRSRKGRNVKEKNIKTGEHLHLDFYFGLLSGDGHIVNSKLLMEETNSINDEIDLVFTKNNNVVYFTRNIKSDKKKKREHLELFKADVLTPGLWANIVKLPFNNDLYSVGHPSLSDDDKTLYFASDMSGGLGGLDIYKVAVLEENSYGEPVNLGASINTSSDEKTPFVFNNALYFSSTGRGGLGGFDIFSIELNGNSKAINLESPINSANDDFSFVRKQKKNYGYFTSNRISGKGSDDIYFFKGLELNLEEDNKNNDDVVEVEYGPTASDVVYSEVKKSKNSDTIEAAFKQQENDLAVVNATKVVSTPAVIETSINNNLPKVVSYNASTIKSTDYSKVTNSKTIQNNNVSNRSPKPVTEEVIYFNSSDSSRRETEYDSCQTEFDRLNNVYFDLNKTYIRADAANELDKVIRIMRRCPNIKITASSHTDSRASYDYNLDLSERRSTAIIRYIIRNGNFSENRVRGIGYGEARPKNRCADGVKCTESEHQINRRTQFEISNY